MESKPRFCQSCGMPLEDANNESANDYCHYCSDEFGGLKSREVVHAGIVEWLKLFAPEEANPDFAKRADHYMKAMPAWAED